MSLGIILYACLAIYISLVKCLFKYFVHLKKLCFLTTELKGFFLHIFDTSPLLDMYFANSLNLRLAFSFS